MLVRNSDCLRLWFVVYAIVAIEARIILNRLCEPFSQEITRQCYKKDILISVPHSPNQIAVDLGNNLYFSFDSGQGEYVPAKKSIGNKTISVLKGIKDAFAIAADRTSGEVYFGGSHGIYRYDPTLRILKRLAVPNLDIWWLVVKTDIYFIKFPSLSAYWYHNRTLKYVYALKNHNVHQFVFDVAENIYFINSTGLYGIKNGDTNAHLLRSTPRFLGISTDRVGNVYVCSEEGIFLISPLVQKVKRIVNIQGVLGMTFDNDNNIIYSDSHDIVRLVPFGSETNARNASQP